jgi:hypothetical protein
MLKPPKMFRNQLAPTFCKNWNQKLMIIHFGHQNENVLIFDNLLLTKLKVWL